MQKIDLHIHTISSLSDHVFDFSIEKLVDYVKECGLSCIAITNHNIFDLSQFKEISSKLSVVVYPGIEINLENGHILLISENKELEDFELKCREVTKRIKKKDDVISLSEFMSIFTDISRYIIIPHYDKEPKIGEEVIRSLRLHISAGEVSSPKKFMYCLNDSDSLVPVYFSDIRISTELLSYPARQTYIDIGEISFSAIKHALRDKNKVFLTKSDGHKFFDILGNGLKISTGLNVVLGERSTGKTYTLNKIFENFENVKYIRQFELLERDDDDDSRRFNNVVGQKQSLFTQSYLKELKAVVDDLSGVNLENDEREIEKYLHSLLKNAKESERADSYSKARLFSESYFAESELASLRTLISAVQTILENKEYKKTINKYIDESSLKDMAIDLMSEYTREFELNLKKRWVNDLINSIQKTLQVHTASTRIKEIDFYRICINRAKVNKFIKIIKIIKKERVISNSDFQGFRIHARTRKFSNATEMKNLSGKKIGFTNAYQAYDDPYVFLKELRQIDGLEESNYYKYFINIDYQVLNKYGFQVSGGERSEFRLLQEISDAQQFNILLIDEPESSFDNLFLKNEVNQLIKGIAKSMPVVIVTHNNTVGASIQPDYLLYTSKLIKSDGTVEYEVYSGHPSDKNLIGLNGKILKNFEIMLNCLEAGQQAYIERGTSYEILKN